MSRSYKRTAVSTEKTSHNPSCKDDKKQAHKALRVHFRTALQASDTLDEFQFDEHNYAHSEKDVFAKKHLHVESLNVAVSKESGHIRIKAITDKLKSERDVHKLIGK